MIKLLIKGARPAAHLALENRNIDGYKVKELNTDFNQVLTTCVVPMRHIETVLEWFTEPSSAPFPAGTLLLYSWEPHEVKPEQQR